MKKRVMITGCNGQLGQKLIPLFGESFELSGVDLMKLPVVTHDNFEYTELDITKRLEVKDHITDFQPDIVINACAMTDVDKCEINKKEAWGVNVDAVENLIATLKLTATKIIHVSTDYIFDGSTGNYNEAAQPNPINYYGRCKLASENMVRMSSLEYTIVRTSVLYTCGIDIKTHFVSWVIDQLRKNNKVSVIKGQWGSPTLAENLAEGIRRIIKLNISGVYHISGRECVNRFEFSRKIASVFNYPVEQIIPIPPEILKQTAQRPQNTCLNVSKAKRELGIKLLNVEEGLKVFKAHFEEVQPLT